MKEFDFPRLLVWTRSEPDFPSGSPAVLAEILSYLAPDGAEVVAERRAAPQHRRAIDLRQRITRLRPIQWVWPLPGAARLRPVLRYFALPLLVVYGLYRVMRFRPDYIFTIYLDDLWIGSAYLISLLTGTPVAYYVHDPYLEVEDHAGGLRARIGRFVEERALRRSRVFVLYDSLRDHYARRYGIDPIVVRHPAMRGVSRTPPHERGVAGPVRTIGFAGAIYENNAALLRMLGDTVRASPRLHLRLWTTARDEVLDSLGLTGESFSRHFESEYQRFLNGLAKCDLLYLPLAFSDTPKIPRESFRMVLPTKAVDYLLAGPEILVHCPDDFELARFFREHEAAHVLTTPDPDRLQDWLERWLYGDVAPVVETAAERALAQFRAEPNLARLMEGLSAPGRLVNR